MIEVTYRRLRISAEQLKELAALAMPGVSALRTAKVLRAVTQEMPLYDAQWDALLAKYGEAAENEVEGKIKIKPEHAEVWTAEANRILDSVATLQCERIPEADIEKIEGIKPMVITQLDWAFSDGK